MDSKQRKANWIEMNLKEIKQNGFKWIEKKGSKGPKPSSRQLRL